MDILDPSRVKRVCYSERNTLPEIPAIYYLINDRGTILYVGQTKNLHNRCGLGSHHVFNKIENPQRLQIAYIEAPENEQERLTIERKLIAKFSPKFNLSPNGQEDLLSEIITLRVSQSEKNNFSNIAEKEGVSISPWVRSVILKQINTRSEIPREIGEEAYRRVVHYLAVRAIRNKDQEAEKIFIMLTQKSVK